MWMLSNDGTTADLYIHSDPCGPRPRQLYAYRDESEARSAAGCFDCEPVQVTEEEAQRLAQNYRAELIS
mgnify:CR=1 FL=1